MSYGWQVLLWLVVFAALGLLMRPLIHGREEDQ